MSPLRDHLLQGCVIPALPLALHEDGRWSERHQRALVRYYVEAGAGGLAVGVHSTQFEIRDPAHGLFEPVLELAAREIDAGLAADPRPFAKVAGVCGAGDQARREAQCARDLGYDAALVSLTALRDAPEPDLAAHCRAVADILPIIGFYLQPAVGGRRLGYGFWRDFCAIENAVAIKIAPFNRYFTNDVARAAIDSGRDDLALYTGNDDNIIADLLTPFRFGGREIRIVGGLLGQWGVWTKAAVELLAALKAVAEGGLVHREWLARNAELTDANAAIFDAAGGFAGCIPGIMEVLRRQRLVPSTRCLNPAEALSPGQAEEITRVSQAYPWLTDDAFVAENIDRWLA
ncbi:MAG: hypothetical protein R3F11_28120 [Verrucomicrobiales bacterium]